MDRRRRALDELAPLAVTEKYAGLLLLPLNIMTAKKKKKESPERIPSLETISPTEPKESMPEPSDTCPVPVDPGEGVDEKTTEELPDEESERFEAEDIASQLAVMTENWQRERANFINYKRRVEEEKREIRRYASFDFALDLIRVMDYFESSVSFGEKLPEEAREVINGVKYTLRELTRVLSDYGVRPIEAGKGKPFDSSCMEAVERRVADGVKAGTVLEVQRRGWWLHDRVLRSSGVVVAVDQESDADNTKGEGGD